MKRYSAEKAGRFRLPGLAFVSAVVLVARSSGRSSSIWSGRSA